MTKKHTEKEMHIAIRNYQHVTSKGGHNFSYREAKKRIQDHIDGKRYDSTYYVLENILYYKLNNVNYALGY